ncbi:DegT/DnrJ/EryC1/StrS family aminotransferase [Candidatus Bathyarchaeota archaeon]|nr:DegT/DnrJ/EryC1/StrS family aminotransferase [Candidatus Bathyarchaeota archaeon]
MDKLAIEGGGPVSATPIPIARPVFSERTMREVVEVLRSGYLRQGPRTEEFEERFREKVGARYAYAVNSGTAALHVAYLSILKPGDEVIVPAFTFIATASMVVFSFGRPILADIDGETLTIDPEDVKEKITSRTRAIAPVHLFGNAADMRALEEIAEDHDLYLVNDAAQAHGTQVDGRDVGSLDHLNCYSFYPTKSMTTGEGGMVTTNDPELYRLGCLIRSHGEEEKYRHTLLGFNYRMTEIQAVIGLNQLSRLDEFLEKRRKNAEILTRGLREIPGLRPQRIGRGVEPSYSYYSVLMDLEEFKCSRDEFVEALRAENIGCGVHYPVPLNRQPGLKPFCGDVSCPVSEDVSRRIFSLPVHPGLSEEDLRKILEAVDKVSRHYQR